MGLVHGQLAPGSPQSLAEGREAAIQTSEDQAEEEPNLEEEEPSLEEGPSLGEDQEGEERTPRCWPGRQVEEH